MRWIWCVVMIPALLVSMVASAQTTEPNDNNFKPEVNPAAAQCTQPTAKADYWLGGAGGDIYYSSGDVGIGTSAPDSVFHAKSAASSIMLFEGTGTVSRAAGVIPEATGSRINFIGYTSPSVATWQTSLGGLQVKITDADPNTLKTQIRFLHNSGDTLSEAMVIADDSSVGIGAAAPSTKLEVNGVITASGGTSTDWNTAYGWGDHATAGYDTTNDSWTGVGAAVTTASMVGIGVAGPPITWLDLVANTPPGIPHQMIDQVGPGDAFEWFTLSALQLSYSEGIDVVDNNFKITNTPVLTGGGGSAQGDGITMIQTNQVGIVDFNNQSRARAFLNHVQYVPASVWVAIEFDDDFTPPGGYDQQSEFTPWTPTPTAAFFTPTVAGYYQVNARTEYEYVDPAQLNPNGYVSIAIFVNGVAYAEGNKLQMITLAGDILWHNNAPNVSDVLWLTPQDVVDIRAWQSLELGPGVVALVLGTAKTYVSIHKVS